MAVYIGVPLTGWFQSWRGEVSISVLQYTFNGIVLDSKIRGCDTRLGM